MRKARAPWHDACVVLPAIMESLVEAWATAEVGRFCLVLARLTGVLVALPLTWSFAPARVRGAFAICLAFLLHNAAPKDVLPLFELSGLLLALLSEVALGLTLGFVARLSLAIAEIASDSVAPAMGLAAAQMFDPSLGGQGTVLTKVLRYVAILVALSTGLHHLVLRALHRSFEIIHPGTLVHPARFTGAISMFVAETLVSGVALALPFLAVLLIAQVALAFVARAAPQMQIFSVGFAVTLGVGTMLWITFAPDVVQQFAHQTEELNRRLDQLLVLGGGPP
jgi:flagellar biosynthesis protein FliR